MTLCTIGYQGYTIEEFIEVLKGNGIVTVVDVRFRPQSRKKGFGAQSLFEELYNEWIEYIQMQGLGIPNFARKKFGDKLLEWYESCLSIKELEMRSLVGIINSQEDKEESCHNNISLLCFEADPETCHRSVLAKRLQELIPGLEVVHLGRDS